MLSISGRCRGGHCGLDSPVCGARPPPRVARLLAVAMDRAVATRLLRNTALSVGCSRRRHPALIRSNPQVQQHLDSPTDGRCLTGHRGRWPRAAFYPARRQPAAGPPAAWPARPPSRLLARPSSPARDTARLPRCPAGQSGPRQEASPPAPPAAHCIARLSPLVAAAPVRVTGISLSRRFIVSASTAAQLDTAQTTIWQQQQQQQQQRWHFVAARSRTRQSSARRGAATAQQKGRSERPSGRAGSPATRCQRRKCRTCSGRPPGRRTAWSQPSKPAAPVCGHGKRASGQAGKRASGQAGKRASCCYYRFCEVQLVVLYVKCGLCMSSNPAGSIGVNVVLSSAAGAIVTVVRGRLHRARRARWCRGQWPARNRSA